MESAIDDRGKIIEKVKKIMTTLSAGRSALSSNRSPSSSVDGFLDRVDSAVSRRSASGLRSPPPVRSNRSRAPSPVEDFEDNGLEDTEEVTMSEDEFEEPAFSFGEVPASRSSSMRSRSPSARSPSVRSRSPSVRSRSPSGRLSASRLSSRGTDGVIRSPPPSLYRSRSPSVRSRSPTGNGFVPRTRSPSRRSPSPASRRSQSRRSLTDGLIRQQANIQDGIEILYHQVHELDGILRDVIADRNRQLPNVRDRLDQINDLFRQLQSSNSNMNGFIR